MKPSLLFCSTVLGAGLLGLTVARPAESAIGSPSVFTSIFSFPSSSAGPNGKLLVTGDGTLYGTTYDGGDANNDGTIYSLSPGIGGTYSETVVYAFSGGATGSHPTAGLVMDGSGALYGTAAGGGATPGVVFQLTPTTSGWSYGVIHTFSGTDGADPNCDLLLSGGVLYGTTVRGGAYGVGTVFSLTPASPAGTWSEAVLHSFTAGRDGAKPYSGLAIDASGALYGTTGTGGAGVEGTVFKLTPPTKGVLWPLTTLFAFSGVDGKFPLAGVYLDGSGNIFGTTYVGGGNGMGAVYELAAGSTPGSYTESVIFAFNKINGANPSDVVTPDGTGGFYTTTGAARAGTGGNLVHLTPPASPGGTWTETVLYSFSGGSDGQAPLASVVLDSTGTILYGTSFYGGSYGGGTAFKVQ